MPQSELGRAATSETAAKCEGERRAGGEPTGAEYWRICFESMEISRFMQLREPSTAAMCTTPLPLCEFTTYATRTGSGKTLNPSQGALKAFQAAGRGCGLSILVDRLLS